MIAFLLAFAVAAQAPQDTSGAFHDVRAAQLVKLARARRLVVDRSIRSYQTLAKERISMGLRTRLRDRLFYRRETASRIDWRRGGPINITVVGAREAMPVASTKLAIPTDLQEFLPRLAFDPLDMDELLRIDTTSLRHPLSDGAEAHYRYRTGDSTTISLSDRAIKLVELQVIPRRRDYHLISGSFWIDDATHSVVQIVFRMAKDFNLIEDANDEDRDEVKNIPGFFKPLRFELQYVTIEYGLIHLRWWMPRLFAAEGIFQMGAIKTPLNYERSYADYQVQGDTAVALIARTELGDSLKRCRPRGGMNINVGVGEAQNPSPEESERRRARMAAQRAQRDSARQARRDSLPQAQRDSALAADSARARRAREAEECSKQYHVVVEDSAKLLTSAELPPSIYGDTEELTSDPELAKLARQLEKLAEAPWRMGAGSFSWGLTGNGLIRYNKVEALSVGARTDFDFGRLQADATARIGVGDLEPGLEIGLTRSTMQSWMRASAYRRLDVMDEASGFGSVSTNLAAFLFGHDERDYFRATGGELVIKPAETNTQWYALRLFGEHQHPVHKETDFSLRHVIDSDRGFLLNRTAERADQIGTNLTLRAWHGQDPARLRIGGELQVQGSTGTFDFTREALTLQAAMPLPFRLAAAFEVGAGTSTGMVPLQSEWFLGGTRTMRGYPIGETTGTAFWRARGELARGIPLARISLFSDIGWAGDRNHIARKASLWSAGVGVSFMDGLLRLDLARTLRGARGWRLHGSVDGIL